MNLPSPSSISSPSNSSDDFLSIGLHHQAHLLMCTMGARFSSFEPPLSHGDVEEIGKLLLSLHTTFERFPEWDPNQCDESGQPAWIEVMHYWCEGGKLNNQWENLEQSPTPALEKAITLWSDEFKAAGGTPNYGHLWELPFMTLIQKNKASINVTWPHPIPEKLKSPFALSVFSSLHGVLETIINHPSCPPVGEVEEHLGSRNNSLTMLNHAINDDVARELLLNFGFNPNGSTHLKSGDEPLFHVLSQSGLEDLKKSGADMGRLDENRLLFDAHHIQRGEYHWKNQGQELVNHWKNLQLDGGGQVSSTSTSVIAALLEGNLKSAKSAGLDEVLSTGETALIKGVSWGALGATIRHSLRYHSGWNVFDSFLATKTSPKVWSHCSKGVPDVLALMFSAIDVKRPLSDGFSKKLVRALKVWEPNAESRIEKIILGLSKHVEKENWGGTSAQIISRIWCQNTSSNPNNKNLIPSFNLEKLSDQSRHSLMNQTKEILIDASQTSSRNNSPTALMHVLNKYLSDEELLLFSTESVPLMALCAGFDNSGTRFQEKLEWMASNHCLPHFETLEESIQTFVREHSPEVMALWSRLDMARVIAPAHPSTIGSRGPRL